MPEARFAIELAFITTATLVMRPVGALIFRLRADRVGRRIPLIMDVLLNRKVIRRFIYLIPLMTALNWMSHGTQDISPKFLQTTTQSGTALSPTTTTWIAVLSNLGAIAGGLFFGSPSEQLSRRYTIILCAILGLPQIPIFAFTGHNTGMLALGSFLMQIMVQDA